MQFGQLSHNSFSNRSSQNHPAQNTTEPFFFFFLVFLLGESYSERTLVGYSEELDTTEATWHAGMHHLKANLIGKNYYHPG